ncbi:MAG: adenylosuccinate synthetase, partial [Intestinibacter bartlettii]|nr:adenylosuccinate synthetase [Intestinibacter bartlettii]
RIRRQDIFIDCLSLTVSAQQEEAMESIKAIRMVKENLGCKTILGVSNISFGVPNRRALNSTFLNLALGAGLDLAIINTSEEVMMESMYAYRVINNIDKGCEKYIKKYMDAPKSSNSKTSNNDSKEMSLDILVERGLKDETKELTNKLLEEHDGHYILDKILIPALDKIGVKYDNGEIFLPQMIQAAETIKVSLNIIKDKLSVNTDSNETKGKIIVATVKGDIHDIGKNIVKIMLENYGYEVIDLGKDVPIETVVETAKKQNIKLIGLSALMTTTVQNMKDTIKAIRESGIDAKVIVGGAVLTEEYAKKLKGQVEAKNKLVKGVYDKKEDMFNFDEIYSEFMAYAEKLRPFVADTTVIVYDAIKAGKKVLFEGAQGTLLDLDLGTYPYVTSSHPTSGGFAVGAGIGPNMIKDVVGIVKAYTTRVGEGPFVTEQLNEIGDQIRIKGHEFGTVT